MHGDGVLQLEGEGKFTQVGRWCKQCNVDWEGYKISNFSSWKETAFAQLYQHFHIQFGRARRRIPMIMHCTKVKVVVNTTKWRTMKAAFWTQSKPNRICVFCLASKLMQTECLSCAETKKDPIPTGKCCHSFSCAPKSIARWPMQAHRSKSTQDVLVWNALRLPVQFLWARTLTDGVVAQTRRLHSRNMQLFFVSQGIWSSAEAKKALDCSVGWMCRKQSVLNSE